MQPMIGVANPTQHLTTLALATRVAQVRLVLGRHERQPRIGVDTPDSAIGEEIDVGC
jgi:hypothetical protein